jgi:SAM-dependent methyltransferase
MPVRPPRVPRPEFTGWEDWYARRDYREMPWYSPRPSPWLVRAVRRGHIARRSSVLDNGCGTGTNVLWLAQHGFRVSGVDVSPTAIRIAGERVRRAGVAADLRVASADDLPFRSRSFDAALDTGLFHALPLRLRGRYAKEVARVVRPDGRFLLTWIPREVRTSLGPPHRPSLAEVAAVFEPAFVFAQTEWHAAGSPEGWKVLDQRFGRSTALLVRRRGRQPPPR